MATNHFITCFVARLSEKVVGKAGGEKGPEAPNTSGLRSFPNDTGQQTSGHGTGVGMPTTQYATFVAWPSLTGQPIAVKRGL